MNTKETTYAQEIIKCRIKSKYGVQLSEFQDNHHDDYSDYSDYDDIIYSESYSWSEEYSTNN